MDTAGFLYQATVYLVAAVVAVPVAKRLGFGSVLGYLVAGVLIGPYVLGLVGEEGQDVMHFAEFGVVLMLFLIGLELQPRMLWRMRGPILGLGGLQVGVTAAGIAGLAMAVGLAWQSSVAVGLILALSSTALVLQTLTEKGLMRADSGHHSFAVLLFQDIAVIPMLGLFPLLATAIPDPSGRHGDGAGWIAHLPGWLQTLVVLGAVAAIVLAGRFLIRPAFRVIAGTRLPELFTAASLLLVIGIALLMTQVGLSPALGTFLAGVVLADSEYRHELESDIGPFKGLLLGLFFIAVGASIDFNLVAANPIQIAAMTGGLIAGKFLLLFLLGRVFRMGLDQNLIFAFALAQGGEFGFVLFSFAVQQGVLTPEVANPFVVVVALSMALTPLLMLLNEKLVQPRFGTTERQGRPADAIDEDNPVIIAGFGNFGNIVGRLLRANHVAATVLEYDSDNVEMLRKLGYKVFYGDASRVDLLRAAGAERAELLVIALDDHEKILALVETVKKHFPNLSIFTRANGRRAAYELLEAGIDNVYRETLDAALRVGTDVLARLGFRAFQAHRAAQIFRRHDEVALRELAHLHRDESAYISRARQRIADLEEVLATELKDEGTQRDAGWDTESLRREFANPSEK
ncbi:MAG: monovalent cation:proton antiporter-2 (CPA2) family protein [Myxococcota bacterium]|nr:monovalent cation:proton antiporter-2 (CPA2) family protein [Myxococcota bacterium]